MSNPEVAIKYNSLADDVHSLKAFVYRWVVEPWQRWYQRRVAMAELRGQVFSEIGLKRAEILHVYGDRPDDRTYRA